MKKLFCILLVIVMMISSVPFVCSEDTTEIFVSPYGDDSAAGTADAPLATLEGAKTKACSVVGNVKVLFRGGYYTFASTVNFTAEDKENVTYAAYNGEKVVFTSGTAYTGFDECTVNGVRAFCKNVGDDADFNVLFNEQTSLPRTRYPESGYFFIKKVSDDYCTNPSGAEAVHNGYDGMFVSPADVPSLKNEKDVVARVLHYWKDEMLPVSSYDTATGLMRFTKASSMTFRTIDRYFLENVFEALDKPGEWYLDKSEGILYYIPQDGESADTLTLWGSDTETLVSVSGADGISFEGITFRGNGFSIKPSRDFSQAAYDAPSCVTYEAAADFHITGCDFRDIAACAVFLGSDVQNAEISSCYFENIGAQGVYVRGENLPLDNGRVTKNIRITNNCIYKYGREYFNAVGVLVIHANSIDICNNEIHDGFYTAISVGWVWGYSYTVTSDCRICDNLVYDIGQGWLSDMGGVYTLGNQPGTIISGNVFHNVAADPGEGGYGGWGIYLDEGSSYITVEKNLVFACGNDSYHLHYGSYNTVRNNIFALSGESQIRVTSAPDRCTPPDGGRNSASFTGNIILSDGKSRIYSALNKDSYASSGNIMWDLSSGGDLYFSTGTSASDSMTYATALRKGFLDGSDMIADPGFADAANFDFTLGDDSAAVKNGFERWDYSRAGTLAGTVVGTSYEGGSTSYSDGAEKVPVTRSKEKGRFFVELWNRIVSFFKKITAFFSF